MENAFCAFSKDLWARLWRPQVRPLHGPVRRRGRQLGEGARAFIHASQAYRSEVQRPDPFVDLLKADIFSGEHFGQKQRPAAPADAAVAADAPNFQMPGILERRHPRGQRARRDVIDGHGEQSPGLSCGRSWLY